MVAETAVPAPSWARSIEVVNDGEVKQLTGKSNLIAAGKADLGVSWAQDAWRQRERDRLPIEVVIPIRTGYEVGAVSALRWARKPTVQQGRAPRSSCGMWRSAIRPANHVF